MEGSGQFDDEAGNEQESVGKIQIKDVTMATSHWLPSPGTCHCLSLGGE